MEEVRRGIKTINKGFRMKRKKHDQLKEAVTATFQTPIRGRMPNKMPVMKEQCATCPFREHSEHRELMPVLIMSALTEASRICHHTGVNALYRTKKPEQLCRGAREMQLRYFYHIGYIEAPTDEAWDKKLKELGL